MIGVPRFGRMSTRSWPGCSAHTAPSSTASSATRTVMGRRIAAVTRFIAHLRSGSRQSGVGGASPVPHPTPYCLLPTACPAAAHRLLKGGAGELAVIEGLDEVVLSGGVADLRLREFDDVAELGPITLRREAERVFRAGQLGLGDAQRLLRARQVRIGAG